MKHQKLRNFKIRSPLYETSHNDVLSQNNSNNVIFHTEFHSVIFFSFNTYFLFDLYIRNVMGQVEFCTDSLFRYSSSWVTESITSTFWWAKSIPPLAEAPATRSHFSALTSIMEFENQTEIQANERIIIACNNLLNVLSYYLGYWEDLYKCCIKMLKQILQKRRKISVVLLYLSPQKYINTTSHSRQSMPVH